MSQAEIDHLHELIKDPVKVARLQELIEAVGQHQWQIMDLKELIEGLEAGAKMDWNIDMSVYKRLVTKINRTKNMECWRKSRTRLRGTRVIE